MKKILFIVSITLFSSCTHAQIKNQEFARFINLFVGIEKYPYNYKKDTPKPIYQNAKQHRISLELAEKYLGFTNWDWHAIKYDYNSDEDILTERTVENPPLAHLTFFSNNYAGLVYRHSRGLESDTLSVVLETFTLHGEPIDKIEIGGQYTREDDWKDVVFIKKNILRIFDYKTNLDNYNIKGSTYYIIDEKQPLTVVEINDYQIDENGKINLIKTHPKKYLKESADFYRSYHKDSDDPMNEYDY